MQKAWQGTEASGKNAAMIMRQSKVCLNLYREQHRFHGEYNGTIMRNFEVPGAGGCLVSPYNRAVEAIFPAEKSCVYFSENLDCIEKIERLVNDKVYRNQIAKNAHTTVSKSHTYQHRAKEILEILINSGRRLYLEQEKNFFVIGRPCPAR